MDAERVQEAKARLAERPTDELLSIYGRHDETEWTPEAFAAMGAILAERGVEAAAAAPAPPEPGPATSTPGQRIARAWAAHARFGDDARAGLPDEDQRALGRSLLSVRAGSLLAICIWWVTLVAAARPTGRRFLAVPLVVYTLPYLWIMIALDRRLVRHALVVSGTISCVLLSFLSLNIVAMGIGFWGARHLMVRLPWVMLAGNVVAVLPHLMMFLGAVFGSKAMGPARPGIRAWLFALGLFVLYMAAGGLALRVVMQQILREGARL